VVCFFIIHITLESLKFLDVDLDTFPLGGGSGTVRSTTAKFGSRGPSLARNLNACIPSARAPMGPLRTSKCPSPYRNLQHGSGTIRSTTAKFGSRGPSLARNLSACIPSARAPMGPLRTSKCPSPYRNLQHGSGTIRSTSAKLGSSGTSRHASSTLAYPLLAYNWVR
jgi:hypothetical protein